MIFIAKVIPTILGIIYIYINIILLSRNIYTDLTVPIKYVLCSLSQTFNTKFEEKSTSNDCFYNKNFLYFTQGDCLAIIDVTFRQKYTFFK